MSQAISVATIRPAESRFIATVCAAHFVSHYYMLLLAPLFSFVRADFDVTYTELALALTVFNVVSAALQTPVGFVVDRVGARFVLIAGLALSSIAYAVAGMVNSYWVFIGMYAVAGVGNTVYHPADYSLLSHHTPPERLGQIFSFHSFSGIVGSAIAPVTLLYMQSQFGWRGAYIGASIFGLIVLLVLIAQPEPVAEIKHADKSAAKAKAAADDGGWRVLMTAPILLNFAFFLLLAVMNGGLNTYLVVALGALYGTPPAIANMSLTGVLAIKPRAFSPAGSSPPAPPTTPGSPRWAWRRRYRHCARRPVRVLVYVLVMLMSFSGFGVVATFPSRDMLVRSRRRPARSAGCSASSAPASISGRASPL